MRRYQVGFTLIELMVTLAVAAVLVGIAAPSFNTMILNNRATSLGDEVAGAMSLARSEAVKRGTRVSVCASSNGTSCTGSWNQGFIVFVDTAASDLANAPVVEANNIIQVWGGLDPRAQVTQASARSFVRFTANGSMARTSANPFDMTVKMAKCSGENARQISVGLAGVVTVARASCI